ncbi:filamentous hemagglutinin N-terminal domain-containing protein [Pseudanabaenaceae cyanobacterium LEGE 13415]|nr:filamentous hemagglutinin N-terminal domain-containing protein [Pseudanabaenaceae cyanobacterium LEGE 13415]
MRRILSSGLIAWLSTIALSSVSIAQVVPDTTFSSEQSTVTSETVRGLPSDLIRGGAIRGINLFHSFSSFNIPEGRGAYFANPDAIRNIFARVTGERSQIFGRLGVLGDANLFLINPNGVVFEQNSSLDVGGSFVVTTADAIQFGDRGSFSATAPGSPTSVLTVDPSAFVFNRVPTGAIVNRSISSSATSPISGLQVRDGKNLLFVGGNIEFDRGIVATAGGRIELAGLAGAGVIGLDPELRLNVPSNQERANLSLSNDAQVAAIGTDLGRGEIIVNAHQLTATGGGRIFVLRNTSGESGNLVVNAATLELSGYGNLPSGIFQGVFPGVHGLGGTLIVNAQQIRIMNGAAIFSTNAGSGEGANLQIRADSIDLSGTVDPLNNRFSSGLGSTTTATGNAGSVSVSTRTLRIFNGATLSTSSRGSGQGGNLQIRAKAIELVGDGTSLGSLAYAEGNAGNVALLTENLSIRDGAFIATSTYGGGRGGTLQVEANEIDIVGRTSDDVFSSFLGSLSFPNAGDAGNVSIVARNLSIRNGAAVTTSSRSSGNGGLLQIKADSITLIGVSKEERSSLMGSLAFSKGNAGNVTVSVGTLNIRDRARLTTTTDGTGRGGDLQVEAGEINLSEGASLESLADAEGNAGNMSVTAKILNIRSGAFVATSSRRTGNGGNLQVRADSITLTGRSPDDQASSFLGSLAFRSGNAGATEVTARLIRILSGAVLSTSSLGQGQGGNLVVNADAIEIIGVSPVRQFGSGLLSRAAATGNAGNVAVTTKLLEIRDGGLLSTSAFREGQGGDLKINADLINLTRGEISARSQGRGNSGNIQIRAGDRLNALNSSITSSSNQATAGSISIRAGSIRLRENSDIRTETRGIERRGGNITLTARDYILALEDSDILAFSVAGQGGNITFNTPAFFSIPRYVPKPNQPPGFLEGNNQVDVNATGTISGVIAGVPSISFLQDSLNILSQSSIDTQTLIANSCIVRDRVTGSFLITGAGGLPIRPGDPPLSPYATGTIQAPSSQTPSRGDPTLEPQAAYQLPDGKILFSRECSN